MAYTGAAKKLLDRFKAKEGDFVLVEDDATYRGVLMPRTDLSSDEFLVVKMDSGYNIGIRIGKKTRIEKLELPKEEKVKAPAVKHNPSLKTIAVLHTGGTIASKVDYRTGGVVSAFSPEELLALFPKLDGKANFRPKFISNMWSEDMNFAHHQALAEEAAKQIKSGADGVIIGHGTDTMHYTSAMLSFMLQDIPVPVVLVGAQRSSDRGSSDAEVNLLCATHFATKGDYAGVCMCMHENSSDDSCLVIEGTKARKMHTSRRDAFRPINQEPLARVWADGRIEWLRQDYPKRDEKRKLKLLDKYEEKVALVKIHPGIDPGVIAYYGKKGYKGIVIEGTGLGHAPINKIDEHTKKNFEMFENISEFIEDGGIMVMASQCIYGRVNMNVYSTGRDLLNIGVIPAEDMTAETAYMKLAWALGQTKDGKKAKELMQTNIAGEITEKTKENTYLK